MKKILLLILIGLTTQLKSQMSPLSSTKGFNVFTRQGYTMMDGHTDGPIAIGGDLTIQGFNIIAMNSSGSYPFGLNNLNNYGLVINGKVNYISGNQSYVNRGFLKLNNTLDTRIFTKDCNNANINTKLTKFYSDCNTAYNSNPSIQMTNQQSLSDITSANGLNFDSIFNVLISNSISMSGYITPNSCGGNFNIIPPPINASTITLVNNKINVVNLTTTQLTSLSLLTINNPPNSSRPLIININGSSSFTWTPTNIAGISSTNAPYIIYNFYNNNGTILISGGNTIEGSILAPFANLNKSNSQNIEGQIISNSFVNNGGEVHYFPFNSVLPKCTPCNNIGSCTYGFVLVSTTCMRDLDKDCVADIDDKDDDNDGILDLVECGGYDPLGDCDNDGVVNYLDQTPGCATPIGNDIYGNPYLPLIWSDCNSDGINDFFDNDRDGIINSFDLDSDNDGILDIDETRSSFAKDNDHDGMADGVDNDHDGIMSSADSNDNLYGGAGLSPQDLDRDGKPNYLDLDSDGDGITDITEALGIYDNDGIYNGTDADSDGLIPDNYIGFGGNGITPIDSDNDEYPDVYDIDSDNDGISDNIEAQSTCSYKTPTGIDSDGDGVDNSYDLSNNSCNRTSGGLTPYDKDGDTNPDYLDSDTDGDGAPDMNEASGISGNFITNKSDTDGDGLIDQFDTFNILNANSNFKNNVTNSNMGTNGSFNGPIPSGSNVILQREGSGDCSSSDRDWRSNLVLPLNIIDISVTILNSNVRVNWTVDNENNIEKYIVEVSTNGINFSQVSSINSNNQKLYNINFYINNNFFVRIKQVDKDGKFYYSKTLYVRLESNTSIINYNNKLQINVKSNKSDQLILKVYSVDGKIITQKILKTLVGNNVFYTDIDKGIYYVNIQSTEINITKLIIN